MNLKLVNYSVCFATDIKEIILLEFASAGGMDSLFYQGLNGACGVFLEFSQHIFSTIKWHMLQKKRESHRSCTSHGEKLWSPWKTGLKVGIPD